MTLRILHVLDHSIPLHSGYTFRTLAILREQRRLGWETFHVTSPKHLGATGAEEDVDGLHFYRTLWQPAGLATKPLIQQYALMRALEARLDEVVAKVQPDILHAHSPVLNALPTIRVARRHGLPAVYEIRAFWEDAAVDHGTTREDGLRYRLTRGLETRAIHRADHVTTICEGLRSDIVARGIPADKVTVIPNAVDIDKFALGGEPDAELKRQHGLDGCRVLGFIGSFYAYEGLDLLLRALPEIVKGAPDVKVLLTGGGPQDTQLKALAAQLQVTDRVIFTGRVPHTDVASYYDLIDVLVYPRHSMRLTELVTPLKPLEAMAQGRLMVASDVGGHRELIRDGETGVVFRAGDASDLATKVLHLLAQQDEWEAMRQRGRAFVETERNWPASVARYEQVYARLIGNKAETRSG